MIINFYNKKVNFNQNRARQGKQEKIFETIHMYVEKIFTKFNVVLRWFSLKFKGGGKRNYGI